MTSDIPLTPDMQAELKREIENLDIPYVNYTVETNTNGAVLSSTDRGSVSEPDYLWDIDFKISFTYKNTAEVYTSAFFD